MLSTGFPFLNVHLNITNFTFLLINLDRLACTAAYIDGSRCLSNHLCLPLIICSSDYKLRVGVHQ